MVSAALFRKLATSVLFNEQVLMEGRLDDRFDIRCSVFSCNRDTVSGGSYALFSWTFAFVFCSATTSMAWPPCTQAGSPVLPFTD